MWARIGSIESRNIGLDDILTEEGIHRVHAAVLNLNGRCCVPLSLLLSLRRRAPDSLSSTQMPQAKYFQNCVRGQRLPWGEKWRHEPIWNRGDMIWQFCLWRARRFWILQGKTLNECLVRSNSAPLDPVDIKDGIDPRKCKVITPLHSIM